MRSFVTFLVFVLAFSSQAFAGYDMGYPDTRGNIDVNGDGKLEYCRKVGTPSSLYIACDLNTDLPIDNPVRIAHQYDYRSVVPVDAGWPGRPHGFFTIAGRAAYCRCVGNPPSIFYSCMMAEKNGWGEQYGLNYPVGYVCDPNAGFIPVHSSNFFHQIGDVAADVWNAAGDLIHIISSAGVSYSLCGHRFHISAIRATACIPAIVAAASACGASGGAGCVPAIAGAASVCDLDYNELISACIK
ncbi:MAG: hypothetical protein HQK53_08240 [Oligoflexia bacterium]|nr:hypothetical protein [Oligoflexia bacterium]